MEVCPLDTYACEHKLCRDQRPPFVGSVCLDQLGSDRAEKLSECQHQLISTDHESTDLERGELGNVGNENGLSKTDAETDKDCGTEPALPVVRGNLGH